MIREHLRLSPWLLAGGAIIFLAIHALLVVGLSSRMIFVAAAVLAVLVLAKALVFRVR